MVTSARTTERCSSRIKAKESQERKNEEEKVLQLNHREGDRIYLQQKKPASTSSEVQGEAAVGECKKEPSH